MKLLLFSLLVCMFSIHTSAQVIADHSFEASGPTNSPWTSTSINFGSSFCDEAGCGNCGGFCFPNTGNWYVWFGGTTNAEKGTISQDFNSTTTGDGVLTYFIKVPMKGFSGDTLSILLDGDAVSQTTVMDSIGSYQQINVNVGSITSGSHNLTFQFKKQASSTVVNVLIDDVQLTIGGPLEVEEIDFTNGIQISNNLETGSIMVAYNFTENQNIHLTVIDIMGKVVYSNQLIDQQTNKQVIDVKEWSSGFYNVSLTSDKGFVKTKKVIVN